MPAASRLYVDANIFIYAFEATDELGDALTKLLMARTTVPSFLVTSELTLAELLVAPYKNADDRLIDLYDRWTTSGPHLTVDPVSRPVLWYAAVLRSQYLYLKLPDAIHLATAMLSGCSHFLTADSRLSSNYELLHRRHGMKRGPLSIEVMRPSADLVQQLIEAARND